MIKLKIYNLALIFLLKYYIILCDENNIQIDTLEESNTDLLDVTDNHNLNIIVTTAKKIYTGIPPQLKATTEANIINATSIITLNQNFLLAACLQDSLLSKIRLSDGQSSSILTYNNVDLSLYLDLPTTSCSLSILDNIVFIGYTRNEYYTNAVNKTIILIKLSIQNKDSEEGPSLDENTEIKFFIFPETSIKTESSRQISCEPLLVSNYDSKKHNCNNYRLICVIEVYDKSDSQNLYFTYINAINDTFNGFEETMRQKRIKQLDTSSGFRLYKLNNTYLRAVIKINVADIYLTLDKNSMITISWKWGTSDYSADLDLFSYNNRFIFLSQRVNDIASFRVDHKTQSNYLSLNNNDENKILKILGYHDQSNKIKNTIFIFQSSEYIKYFTFNSSQTFEDVTIIDTNTNTNTNTNSGGCTNENEALLKDSSDNICYPKTKIIKGYKYRESTNFFEKCYSSCDFCSETPGNNLNHKCEACAEGYLPSYAYPGNCYKINGLQINEDKKVNNQNDENFVSTICSSKKIESTGECNDQCPISTVFYEYIYDNSNQIYTKNSLNPPKFAFDNKCIDACPSYTNFDENNICQCQFAYYKQSEETICYSDENCPSDLLYQNPETKECYSSLDDCFEKGNNYFFNKLCYKEGCPENKVELKIKHEDFQNYFISKLSLDNNIKEKICICDTSSGVWSNINSNNEEYYQECLSSCPNGYEAESITNHCIEKIIQSTAIKINEVESTVIEIITTQPLTTEIKTTILEPPTTIIDIITTQPLTTEIKTTNLEPPTTILDIISTQPLTTEIKTTILEPPTTIINIVSTQPITTEIKTSLVELPPTSIITIESTQQIINEIKTTLIEPPSTIIKIESTQPIITEIKTTIFEPTSTILTTESTQSIITEIETTYIEIKEITNSIIKIISTQPFITEIKSSENEINSQSITTEIKSSIISENNQNTEKEIIYPEEYYKNKDDCLVIYENKCYHNCPEGTCINQNDKSLKSCILIKPGIKIFNGICFDNFEEISNNIKAIAENKEIITNEAGIIIRGYSTKEKDDIELDSTYSEIDLGECETKIREFYGLSEDTELYIIGIDSPNINKNSSTSVYNYGVYLENGTLLDHTQACKNSTIIISSSINNPDLVNLDEANYFSDFGYDIYNESNEFYTDNCAHASIDGNDITLADRKKYFYPKDVSLCNESCYYNDVNFTTKRFLCECDIFYNFSQINILDDEEIEEEFSYIDYFLSLINYKIAVCYELFFEFKSYYYNAGFYIVVGTLVFVIASMFIFLTIGMRNMNLQFLENMPNKHKLLEAYREQTKKREEMCKLDLYNGNQFPPKKKIISSSKKALIKTKKYSKKSTIDTNIRLKNKEKNLENQIINKSRIKKKKKKRLSSTNANTKAFLLTKSNKKINKYSRKETEKIFINSKNREQLLLTKLETKKNFRSKKKNIIKDDLGLKGFISDEQVTKKEINSIPFTQALRIDKRNFGEIFLSVLFHQIEIIDLFYYRNIYSHLSITLSIYIFELCLDLTLNCLLYTDDVVSEKYNNNGSIEFFTTLSLSFMSNIFASIIAYIVGKLAMYGDLMEMIINEAYKKKNYLSNIIKFKKYLSIKLIAFYPLQIFINLCMCYYLMIFCTVYHKTQESIMINYIVGISESMAISLGLTIITSLVRYLSIKYKNQKAYNASRFLFEKF